MSYLIRLENAAGDPLWFAQGNLYGNAPDAESAELVAETVNVGYLPDLTYDGFGPGRITTAPVARVRISGPDGTRYIER